MARIRHIAIATQDPEGTARFYKEGLGLQEVGTVDSDLAQGYYLNDGHINVAILKFKSDGAAVTEGTPRHTGIHHFEVQVENLEAAQKQVLQAGATHRPMDGNPTMRPEGRANVEVKFLGPDGVTVDLSEQGWTGAS